MSKTRNSYQCESCGASLSKWAGQCPECSEWNSVVESAAASPSGRRFSGYAGKLSSTIRDLTVVRREDDAGFSRVLIEVEADGFLYNMVRNLVALYKALGGGWPAEYDIASKNQ